MLYYTFKVLIRTSITVYNYKTVDILFILSKIYYFNKFSLSIEC